MGRWDIRDQTELPPIGEGIDLDGVAFTRTSLPGTWNRWHRDDFRDRILLLRLRLDVGDEDAVRLMVHSTEHFRVWLDGDYLFGGQGTQYSFPTPHLTPAGQYTECEIARGVHELLIAIKRPPATRDAAELVFAAATLPDTQWVPNAFRPPVED
jgi:hypothetical protein